MLNRLQQKWKVNGGRLFLIIATFAIGGSACGYAGRKIMLLFSINQPIAWTIVYLLLVTFLWPLAVLLISIPLGQFRFFTTYLLRIGDRIGLYKNNSRMSLNENRGTGLPQIAIFASGTGSNAEKIIESTIANAQATGSANNPGFRVAMIVSNKADAGVLNIAAKHGIPTLIIEREKFFRGNAYVDELKNAGIDFIVLAGFLWKIPQLLINAYRDKIVNIHPALLPKYGGKGMYGNFVHESVIANGDPETGITIHWVDEHYDHGSIIFQATCRVLPGDTAQTLASRIHQLEHKHYPEVIANLLAGKLP